MKSISKLIVAGLSLAVTLGAYAAPLTVMKNSNTKVGDAPMNFRTNLGSINAKHYPALEGLTKLEAHKGAPVASAKQLKKAPSVLPSLSAPALLPAASCPLIGINIYCDDSSENPYGIYKVSTSDPSLEFITTEEYVGSACAAFIIDGKYYIDYLYTFWGYIFGAGHYVYDVDTWELLEYIDATEGDLNLTHFGFGCTYDKTTGNVYGCFYNESGSACILGIQDPETFEVTEIAPIDRLNSIAAAADGTLYGIDSLGQLVIINKETAEMTVVGDTGFEPYYNSAAAIDPKTGVMYWTLSPTDDGGYMIAVDTATGEGQLLYQYDYNNEIVGLAFNAPNAAEGAPAAVENLNVAFDGDLCTGTISFNMPTTTFDGSDLVGTYPYVITRDGEVIKEGEAFTGYKVEYVDVVPARGYYTYAVVASNEAGNGPKTQLKQWIGPDAPVAPNDVTLEFDGKDFTIAWEPVASTVNSGADVEGATYRVRFYANDAMVVFEGDVADNSVTFAGNAPENLTVFYATVQAVTPRTVSDLGVSNSIAMGHAIPPFREDFDNPDNLNMFTILDENYDGSTWQIVTPGVVRVVYNYDCVTDMDDWLVTPPIVLEAGKEYTFAMSVAVGSEYYPERVEAMMGKEPTAEGMTTVLVDPTDLTSSTFTKYASTFLCEESGEYYFGVHGISDADKLYLYLDYVSVSAGVSQDAPVAPAVSVVADPTGALNATVTYTVPSTTINGNETEITKAVVSVNGAEYAVNKNVVAGETYKVDVNVDAAGVYEFGVAAYNGAGEGRTGTATVFVGINRPGVPTNAVLVGGDDVNSVNVSWDAPTVDCLGYPISPDLIVYNVTNDQYEDVAYNTPETSCSYTVDTDEQMFTYCQVYAVTEAGQSSSSAVTNMWPVGPAYQLPMIESFDNGGLAYIMGLESGGAEAYLVTDADFMPDFDGTNGLVVLEGSYVGDWATLFTGRISLDAKVPVVSLAYYCISNDDQNNIEVSVKDLATNEETVVGTVALGQGTPDSWNTVMLSLEAFAGKDVMVLLKGTVLTYPDIIFDSLKVYEPLDVDLAVLNINAPAMVAADAEFDVNVKVMNLGVKNVEAYAVELYNNGESVAKVDAGALASGAVAQVTFTTSLSAVGNQSNLFTAKVICDGDLNADNNVSAEAPVLLEVPNYPTATNLTATATEGGVALAWTEPNLDPENLPKVAVTDDFESYEAFTYTDLGEWTLFDEDLLEVGGVNGVNFPGIIVGETLCAYFVMNTEDMGLTENDAYAAHSGVQYLVSTFPYNVGQCLDWLISPALTGEAQTISLYARSFQAAYPETFQVLYSTTDREIESFEVAAEFENIADVWTRYSVRLPEGAKYFAIRSISYDAFMFFVDDVTYIPASGETMELSLVGYNIYRNGVKINDEPVAETSYVDAEGSANDVYNVTVVYAEGESAASNAASVEGANVSGLNSAVVAAKVWVEGRTIVVAGAQGNVNVYTADGKMLYNAAADTRNAVTVVPGVYVVKAGKSVQKVVVK